MSAEFEDPRKTELRERCATAVDAAGYTVDPARPAIPYPDGSSLKGAIRGDVVSVDGTGRRFVYFCRVDGEKPLAGWLATTVDASFEIGDLEIYVVVEEASDALIATCRAAGAGLLRLRPDGSLDLLLRHAPPTDSKVKKRFARRLKDVRRKLDAKLRLNLANLDQSFQDSYAVTAEMSAAKRDEYLKSIETLMVRWREWGDGLSERLDALAASEDQEELEVIEEEVSKGPRV